MLAVIMIGPSLAAFRQVKIERNAHLKISLVCNLRKKWLIRMCVCVCGGVYGGGGGDEVDSTLGFITVMSKHITCTSK